jgi:Putative auto-transporter adhesin, head GIN domain
MFWSDQVVPVSHLCMANKQIFFKQLNTFIMKTKIMLLAALLFSSNIIMAQSPLRGSGTIVSINPELKDFDKIKVGDLQGNVEVELGKEFSISIDIDDNLYPLLKTELNANTLFLSLDRNYRNRRYIENAHIRVRITMPSISMLDYDGNGSIKINGLTGASFQMKKSGNGNVFLTGTLDTVDIKQDGNGYTDARKLVVKTATVDADGNGDVMIFATEKFLGKLDGNGSIVNYGKGFQDPASISEGNGKVRSQVAH